MRKRGTEGWKEEGGRRVRGGRRARDSLCVTGGELQLWHGHGDGGAGSLSLLSPPSVHVL